MAKPKVEEVKPEIKKAGRPKKEEIITPEVVVPVEEPKVEVVVPVEVVVEEPIKVQPTAELIGKIMVSIDQDLHTHPVVVIEQPKVVAPVVVVSADQKIEGHYIPGHPIPVQPTPVHLIGHLLP